MDLQLRDKNIFIAGSSAGIGLATARTFLEEGAQVMITGRGQERLDRAEAELAERFGANRVVAMCGDMTRTEVLIESLDQCTSVLGPLHSVIANVGIDETSEDLDLDDETWTASLNQNLMGAVRLAREAASRLTGSQDGKAGNILFADGVWERLLAEDEKGWIKRWIRRDVPLNRFGTPEEIADAVVWVASPRASFVNATVITVDGGQVKGPS